MFFLKIVNVIQTYLGNNNKKKDDMFVKVILL